MEPKKPRPIQLIHHGRLLRHIKIPPKLNDSALFQIWRVVLHRQQDCQPRSRPLLDQLDQPELKLKSIRKEKRAKFEFEKTQTYYLLILTCHILGHYFGFPCNFSWRTQIVKKLYRSYTDNQFLSHLCNTPNQTSYFKSLNYCEEKEFISYQSKMQN